MNRETRRAAWHRAGGHCEITGMPLGDPDGSTWECHHRRNKGMGGTRRPDVDALYNLLALSRSIHNGGPQSVHGRRRWSEERGYLIPKHVDNPELWPVWLLGRRWVLLTPSGDYAALPAGMDRPPPWLT